MKVNPLFHKLISDTTPIIVCQGGGDSSKTTSILQRIATLHTQEPHVLTTVTGQDMPNIRGGALKTFDDYALCDRDIYRYVHRFNANETTYYWKNGSKTQFKAFSDEQDVRGSERQYLFMNEVNAFPFMMFWQLQRKTRRQTWIDYNPTSRFWVHEKLLPGQMQDKQYWNRVKLYITDHRHNLFLTPEEHAMYENISDPDMFMVYSRGMTGKIKGLIFGHFVPCEELPAVQPGDRILWGIDYGYTTDPTAVVKIIKRGRQRWAHECCYEPGLSAERIVEVMTANGFQWSYDPEVESIYSEADPDMVNQLRALGLPVMPAIKGAGTVKAGIAKVRQHECYATRASVNFWKELAVYKFLTDEDMITGKEVMINKPVDSWDHCCDAFRYADYTDSFRFPDMEEQAA